jgi:lipoprotein-releasing system ATP-binding protein
MLLAASNLHKTYRKHKIEIPVLTGVDLEVAEHELLCVLGQSGSGKSTLLHLLGTLDKPDSGEIRLDGKRIDSLPSEERDWLRNGTFGFVFQFYHLLPELTALENVLLPQMISHSVWGWFTKRREMKRRATELLERVGLGHRLRHRPRELSGGEMQRTAIARALITRPRILLADEPTGNLDGEKGNEIIALLRDLNRQDGLTIIMVTHNREILRPTDRIVRLTAGRVEPAAEPAGAAQPPLEPAAPGEVLPFESWRRAE